MTDENQEKDELEVFFDGEEHDEISTEKPVDEPAQVEAEPEPDPESVSEPESETTAEEKPTLVPIAALHDERRKAQQLKEEVEALRSKIPVSEEEPDPYDDIEKYNEFQRRKWEREQLEAQEKARADRLDKSRSQMLEQHEDYDEMERIFELMTVTDRSLVDQMFASGDEAKFAYETAKAYKESLLPQQQPQTEQLETEKPVTEVPNLAKVTAQAPNTPQVEQEATIEDIFADQEY